MSSLEEKTAVWMGPACLDRVDKLSSERADDAQAWVAVAHGLVSDRGSIRVSEVKPFDNKASGT
jgi:hypothetical protein